MKDANNKKNGKRPIQTMSKVHGKIGVQSFSILTKENKLMTTGRDGMLKFYKLRIEKEEKNRRKRKSLLMLHGKKMPMDWISGTYHHQKNDAIFILGFKEVHK